MSKFAPHKKSTNQPRASSSTVCQKCLQRGHYIYECKSERPYVSRPSRTQQLENPRLLAKLKAEGKPSVEVPEEFKSSSGIANKILEAKEKERAEEIKKQNIASSSRKRARSSHSSSSSDSDHTSDSESDSSSSSGSDSDSSSASSSASSRSRGRKRRRSRTPSSGSDSSRRRR